MVVCVYITDHKIQLYKLVTQLIMKNVKENIQSVNSFNKHNTSHRVLFVLLICM